MSQYLKQYCAECDGELPEGVRFAHVTGRGSVELTPTPTYCEQRIHAHCYADHALSCDLCTKRIDDETRREQITAAINLLARELIQNLDRPL